MYMNVFTFVGCYHLRHKGTFSEGSTVSILSNNCFKCSHLQHQRKIHLKVVLQKRDPDIHFSMFLNPLTETHNPFTSLGH